MCMRERTAEAAGLRAFRYSSLWLPDYRNIMLRKVLLSVLWFFVSAPFAAGQETVSINGMIVDPSGAVVSGVAVHLERQTRVSVAEAQTDAKGSFQFRNIPAGTYTLTVPAYLGLASKSIPLHVTGSIAGLKIKLTTDTVSQSVVVGANRQRLYLPHQILIVVRYSYPSSP